MRAHGASLVAISPQTPARNAEVVENNTLGFPVLGDAGNAYAERLGLAFTLPDDLAKLYAGFGISLPDFNGDDSWRLPVPARLVVDASGVIRGVDADPDYTVRPEPEATLAVLEGLADGG